MKNKQFYYTVSVIVLAGTLLRLYNVNYASLWADELYSMLSVHPENSWYEILYMQRTYQPPGYFIMLWGWTTFFGYTATSARLLSVFGGVIAIMLSAALGKKVRDNRLGLILALLVAFNPVQIYYSLEARFYIFAYCLAVTSLWLHLHILVKKEKNILFIGALILSNAALCYFHHFGIFFVFGLFLHDLLVFFKERDRTYFLRKLLVYTLAALIYAPWFFWGLLQGMSTTNFWLKEIDMYQFFTFNLGYSPVVNAILCVFVLIYLLNAKKTKTVYATLFPTIVLAVVAVPLVYSLVRVPILVDRYSMVMGPPIYLMVGLATLALIDRIRIRNIRSAALAFLLLILAIPGLTMSFYNKEKLLKQPWREMGAWLLQQNDLETTNVYSSGIWLKNRFTIDFYLEPRKKAKQFYDMKVGEDEKMYLVESSFVWALNPSLLERIKKQYDVEVIPFLTDRIDFGKIYVCTKKQQPLSGSTNTAHGY